MLGWALLGIGSAVIAILGFIGLFGVVKYGTPILTDNTVPKRLNWMAADIDSAWPIVHDHPFIEMMWWVGEHTVIIFCGYLILRLGIARCGRINSAAAKSRGSTGIRPAVLERSCFGQGTRRLRCADWGVHGFLFVEELRDGSGWQRAGLAHGDPHQLPPHRFLPGVFSEG